jgi:type IV pilus assembly protein PilC
MEFRCRLGTPAGEIVEGLYAADSEALLRRDFEEKGLYVLSLRRAGLSLSFGRGRQRIKGHEFLVFNQELATLLKAGMPLVQSLDILRQRVPNRTLKTVLDSVHDKVKGGSALSDAFAEHQSLFPAVYSASLLAGERSGNLDTVIRRYVGYEKIVTAVRRRTISALIYPAILITMMIVLVAIIVLKVVPAFSEFYANFEAPLPLLTRIIVSISNAFTNHIGLIVLGVVALVALSMSWLRIPAQHERLHRWLIDLPWIGTTALKFYMSQLGRTLATLLGGGIPLVNALEISVKAISNRHLARELDAVRLRVQEGQGFAAALRERGVFPDVAVKMIEVGESTGALQEMLNSLADFYDEEVDMEVGRFITMIEPALLVGMGIIIAGVVLALYMPLFELSSLVAL